MNSSYSLSREVVKHIPKPWFDSLCIHPFYSFFNSPLCQPQWGGTSVFVQSTDDDVFDPCVIPGVFSMFY